MDNRRIGVTTRPFEPCTRSPWRRTAPGGALWCVVDWSVMTVSRVCVNGEFRALGEVGGETTLLDWLRAGGLTGTKEGCAEGECGACAVVVLKPDAGGDRSTWTAINACLVPAAALDGQEVVTAEGLGTPAALHPVQREMAVRGGSQCGYCTPGFICSMAAEFYRRGRCGSSAGAETEHAREAPAADHEHGPNGFDLHALSGNLCRCTGYRPIRDAAYALEDPESTDPLLTRIGDVAPAPVPATTTGPHGDYVRPATLAETLGPAGPAPRRQAGGRLHRLGGRPQSQARSSRAQHRHRPAARAAGVRRRRRDDHPRGGADPVRDRDPAGR